MGFKSKHAAFSTDPHAVYMRVFLQRPEQQIRMKAYREANREKRLAQRRAWYKRNLAYVSAYNSRDEQHVKNRAARYNDRRDPLVFREAARRRDAYKRGSSVGPVNYGVILARAHGMCGICALAFDGKPIHFDHIIPLSRGGPHVDANLQAAHAACNRRKGNKLMSELVAVSA